MAKVIGKLPRKIPIPGIKHVILVSSAKGGVGKSTVSVNLALALKAVERSSKIGLLDADVFGPSIPKLMNLSGQPEITNQGLMVPLVNYGLHVMSMGFLVEEKKAVVWRGLMVMSAIQKLLRGVAWGPLDYLIVDMPPGTGDTQLSITQNIPVSGSIVVTTPQEIALLDARRGITMFNQVGVPILGLVENMSIFICEKCGHGTHIFGHSGVENLSREEKVPLLGSIALDRSLRESCDSGKPIVVAQPDSKSSQSFTKLVHNLINHLPGPLPS
ncbi:iron-sulfur protein NUBPL-like [Panonychus citri]|uniref:iron-sulfur protein NUBPL-like n=1 Tax=Panonychus citri TaxID=50023 RepID=UPI002306FC1A|nr:iron-sulfur protein NUBPL-like [Panonychus citri]XP_053204721.1 iron-sulfur protein NUBPL-like [Panonychus citri]